MTGETPTAGSDEAPATRLQRIAALYGHVSDVLTLPRIGAILGLVLILATGAVGGWGAASQAAEEVPPTAVGVAIEAAPFELTVRRARHFEELRPAFYPEEGFRYLALSVDVTNTTGEPVPAVVLAGAATLDALGLRTTGLSSGPRTNDPTVVRTADGLTQRTFQPGLTTTVVLVWQQDLGESPPAEVAVSLGGHTLRRSAMDGSTGWRDPEPVAVVALPLETLPEQ